MLGVLAFYPVVVAVGLSNTVGYHRLLSHRSFKTAPWLRYSLTFLCAQYSGAPMQWVGAHRVHHTLSDTPADPHTPTKGFWYAHAGWLCGGITNPFLCALFALSGFGLQIRFFVFDVLRIMGKRPPIWRAMARDLEKERFMRWMDVPFVITACFAIQVAAAWLIAGWWGIAWLWLLHVVLNNATWIVNSACHTDGVGARPHQTRDKSRTVAWLALLTHGESSHNSHHKWPRSARHGLDGELDTSWAMIRGLARVGLATDIQLPPQTAPTPVGTALPENA